MHEITITVSGFSPWATLRIDHNVSESGFVSVFGCLGGDATATAVSSGNPILLMDQFLYLRKGKILSPRRSVLFRTPEDGRVQ
jgi:hypothetical protein